MPAGRSVVHEPLSVGQGLGDCEATTRRLEILAEERERELVARFGLRSERRDRLLETQAVVLLQLPRASRRIVDRLAVAGQGDVGVEVLYSQKGAKVVPERVGTACRPEPDGRRDPR
ncbi:hypothetical protein BH18ACT13_BH18ACT13_16170 [soil metagenome]